MGHAPTQLHRRDLARIAAETVQILEGGSYVSPSSGRPVDVGEAVARSVAGTVLVRPGDWPVILRAARQVGANEASRGRPPHAEVTEESTLAACRRLVAGGANVIALNFASAKNPGGGFLGGSRAQEESLARSSGLYASLLAAPEYYETNRACGTSFYTDHLIYSPGVPVFRDDATGALLDDPYEVAFATMPAVNVSALPNAGRGHGQKVERTMAARIEYVLATAARHGHERLVLGAWGCGVFRIDPAMIARLFADALRTPLASAFRHVTFAILDSAPGQPVLAAFRELLDDRAAAPEGGRHG